MISFQKLDFDQTSNLFWEGTITHREPFGLGEIVHGIDGKGVPFQMVYELFKGESVVITSL